MEEDQSKIIYETILNFKNKDESLVLNSIRQLSKIVEILGTDRTVLELLPYLRELLNENSVIVSSLLASLSSLNMDYSTRSLRPDNKETYNAVSYYFEEASAFQERLLRQQAIQCLNTFMGKSANNGFKLNVLAMLGRMKSSNNGEKKMAVSKLLHRAAEICKTNDDLFKSVPSIHSGA